MRILKVVLWLAAATFVHLAGVRLIPHFSQVVDPFLLVVVFHALKGETLPGLLIGLAAGLLTDAVTGGLYGLYGLADTIIGYATAVLAQRLVIQRATGATLVFGLAAALQQAVLTLLVLLLVVDIVLPAFPWVLAKVAASSLLGMMLFVGSGLMGRRMESWRRGRSGRLRVRL